MIKTPAIALAAAITASLLLAGCDNSPGGNYPTNAQQSDGSATPADECPRADGAPCK